MNYYQTYALMYYQWCERNAPALKAFAEGASIEVNTGDDKWMLTPSPAWSVDYAYRVKPTPTVRPYNLQELRDMVGQVIVNAETMAPLVVIATWCWADDESPHSRGASTHHGDISAAQLRNKYTYHNGHICAVQEQP